MPCTTTSTLRRCISTWAKRCEFTEVNLCVTRTDPKKFSLVACFLLPVLDVYQKFVINAVFYKIVYSPSSLHCCSGPLLGRPLMYLETGQWSGSLLTAISSLAGFLDFHDRQTGV